MIDDYDIDDDDDDDDDDECYASFPLTICIQIECWPPVSGRPLHCTALHSTISACCIRGGQKHKSQKIDGCPMDSRFIGLGLLRTVFGIVVACREGPAPEFCCIAGNIEGKISKTRFRPITFDWSVLRT